MSDLSVTNTFVPLTTASASQVNANFSDIVTYINNRDDGTATWDNMNVTATVGNPVTIKSNQSTTEVAIDNTGSDGDPILTFKLSGSTLYTGGVDDSDSDTFKFGTTGLNTNIAWAVPSAGNQVQFNLGSSSAPGIAFVGFASTGIYAESTPRFTATIAGTNAWRTESTNFYPVTDGGMALGQSTNAWSILYLKAGSASAPSLAVGSADNGLFLDNTDRLAIAINGGSFMKFESGAFYATTTNTVSCGQGSNVWTTVYATNTTIQTSHSTFKNSIRYIEEPTVPRGAIYRWNEGMGQKTDRDYIGWIADPLPNEAYEFKEDGTPDHKLVHTNAVLGQLCAGYWYHEKRIKELEEKLANQK